jgi:hypothetical protein
MLYREIIGVCPSTLNLFEHKWIFCWTNAMYFANQTDRLLPYVSKLGERKKRDMQQNFFYNT